MDFRVYIQFQNGSLIQYLYSGASFDDAKDYGFEMAKKMSRDNGDIRVFNIHQAGERKINRVVTA